MKAVLAQLPVPSFLWPALDANVPLAAGYLAAAARERAPGWAVEVLPWQEADLLGDEALVRALLGRDPDVVGFSTYLWNAERTIWIARRLSEAGVTLLLGGPEVLPDNAWLWRAGGFAAGVVGEGEQTFSLALEALASRRPLAEVPGLLVPPEGRGAAPQAERVDLARVPSPYLTGVLGPSADGSVWLETVRGCPWRCAYCHYGKRFDRPAAFREGWLETHLAWASAQGAREMYLMDPSFNVRRDWEGVLRALEAGNPGARVALHTELVADALRSGDAARLARAGLRSCEVGLQSTRPGVLEAVGRRWDRERWLRGVGELADAGISVTVGLIAGLPGDNFDGFAASLDFVRAQAPGAQVQVFPLSLLPGTELRARAEELGLIHLPLPPYTVVRTPGYAPEDLDRAFAHFEEVTGLELDALGEPPLAGRWDGGEGAPYLSGVQLDLPGAPADWAERVAPRAARHLTVWLRGWRETVPAELAGLTRRLPHGVLTVVLEDAPGWPTARLESLRAQAGTGDHYLDRYFRHLYGAGARLVPRLVALVPADAEGAAPRWVNALAERAEIVWRVEGGGGWETSAARLARQGEWVYVAGTVPESAARALLEDLRDDGAQLLFEDPAAGQCRNDCLGTGGHRAAEHRVRLL